ncbi:MAG TPA: small ribosomal subunit Rsm22 family protein [Candidatus Kapabacteria bacterium]|nr:small ribosomal subunit Rsm22 family protein [Candidatus Kapabacteria bacterium]
MLQLPDWFEEALSAATGVNLASQKALEKIAPTVEYLSKRFMRQEDSLPKNYFSDENIRRAYLAYFFATNVLKIAPVLDEIMRSDFFTDKKSLRLLDIGTGVGTVPAGVLLWLSAHGAIQQLDVLATDASGEVCKEALQMMDRFSQYVASPSLRFKTLPATMFDLPKAKPGTFDMIVAQNVLVESPVFAEMLACADELLKKDGALILIEPASRFGSRTLLSFRDVLVRSGYTIYAPCVRQASCPALEKDSDWCHAVSSWRRPKFIRLIDDMIGSLRLSLKYSYIVALKKPLNISATFSDMPAGSLYRVVSERIDEKGRKKFYGCGVEGRIFFEKQKRDTTDDTRAFDEAERYDLVTIQGTEPKANMQRVQKEGSVTIVKKFE